MKKVADALVHAANAYEDIHAAITAKLDKEQAIPVLVFQTTRFQGL
jgi:hypothetical protein